MRWTQNEIIMSEHLIFSNAQANKINKDFFLLNPWTGIYNMIFSNLLLSTGKCTQAQTLSSF